ncbi:MAG: 4Fe-4S binding protein [Anaerolineae bacterium]|nr:4Fe-4S binding protein [Anaerolineae bacterium]
MLRAGLRKPVSPRNPSRARVVINRSLCHVCGACVAVCPADAMYLNDTCLQIEMDACTSCERCTKVCPVHALSMVRQA